MKVITHKGISEFFKTDEGNVAKYYVGDEKAHYFKEFKVVCVIDMEDTAVMHQVIMCELGPSAPCSDMQPEELEAMFDDDNMFGIKAVGVDYETQRFVVSLTHSY